jgi:hypothetical protein
MPTQQQDLYSVGKGIRRLAPVTEEETGLDELELRQPQAVVGHKEIGARVQERPSHCVDGSLRERDVREMD